MKCKYYLLTFEPYAKNINFDILVSDLGSENIQICPELSRRGVPVIKICDKDLNIFEIEKIIRSRVSYVSHIVEIYNVVDSRDIKDIENVCKKLIQELSTTYKFNSFKIHVRRIDKRYPMTSVEFAKLLGFELSKHVKVDLENPDLIIYIEIRSNKVIIGYSFRNVFEKSRKYLPEDWFSKIVGVIENPATVYEIMDLIQLSRSLGIEIRLLDTGVRNVKHLYEKACKNLNLEKVENVKIYNNIDDVLKDIEIPITLSYYAIENETKLIEIAKECFDKDVKIGFVLGNEYDDVSIELRKRCKIEVRLGTNTQQPMRSVVALTYATAIILSTWTSLTY